MPNRTAKFVSAVFASVIAGVPLTATITSTPAPAADECLSAPKGQTPEGSHWYYRIEHPSNRHCWYLREEGDAHAQASSPAPIKQASSKPETAMPGSVANARAELTPRARFDQNATANTGQLPAAANAANIDNTEAASLPGPSVPDSSLTSSVVASRWPNQLAANVPAAPPPATAPITAPAAPAPAIANPPADLKADAAPPPPAASVAPTVPLAAADASITRQSGSAMMLLAIVVGALSVAGLVASVVFSGGKRRRNRKSFGGEAPPVWDIDRDLKRGDRPLPFPRQAAARPNIGAPRELNEPDDLDDRDRIEQMLARLARSTQN